jgi:hypothetical protein
MASLAGNNVAKQQMALVRWLVSPSMASGRTSRCATIKPPLRPSSSVAITRHYSGQSDASSSSADVPVPLPTLPSVSELAAEHAALIAILKQPFPGRLQRIEGMQKRIQAMEREMEALARDRAAFRAMDLLEECPDRGIKLNWRLLELASEAVQFMRDPKYALRLRELCYANGHHPGPKLIMRLLMIFSRLNYPRGIHMVIRDIETSHATLNDSIMANLCLAFYTIGAKERAFQILDLCRGVPLEKYQQQLESSGGGMLEGGAQPEPIPGKDTAVFILERLLKQHRRHGLDTFREASLGAPGVWIPQAQRNKAKAEWASSMYQFYRSLLNYLIVTPAASDQEFAVVIEHIVVQGVSDLVMEVLQHQRIAQVMHQRPALMQMVFGSVLSEFCQYTHERYIRPLIIVINFYVCYCSTSFLCRLAGG